MDIPEFAQAGRTNALTDELPTARTMATTGLRWHVWCQYRRWSVDADYQKVINDGRGDGLLNCAGIAVGASRG
jgi:hypothetical protein